jgi:hypothetical protein
MGVPPVPYRRALLAHPTRTITIVSYLILIPKLFNFHSLSRFPSLQKSVITLKKWYNTAILFAHSSTRAGRFCLYRRDLNRRLQPLLQTRLPRTPNHHKSRPIIRMRQLQICKPLQRLR